MEKNDVVLSMRGICKEFPGVKALQNVDFTLREAEIHALMGENGAGKSTLVKVLTGVHIKDAGEIRIAGVEGAVNIRSPQDAQNLGISTVYQEITLCPNLTVAENMYIGRGNYKFIDWKKQEKKATELLKQLNIPAHANQQLGTCSLAVQQMVAIARAVDMDCKVLILDEPTSSLDDNEVALLFTLMRVLKSHGVGIIFITHFLEQVYEVCDKITVLRNGELVGEYTVSEMPRVKLISAMLGKDAEDMTNLKNMKRPLPDTENIYEAKDLATTEGVRPFDFNIRKGEVNGFTGLLGSGRSESVRAVFAADRITSGKVKINGKDTKITSPKDAMKNGIGYLPEDRKGDGIIQDLSVRENMILAMQVLRGFFHPISRAESEKLADEYIKLLEIKTASKETPIKSLSGGNQQKVILARWLLTHPQYLILDEPTRGIDVGTKIQIQKEVLKLAEKGVSVTFISSEIPEMLSVCQRLIVMRDRKIVGELKGEELSQDVIMQTIAGGKAKNE
ncbi:MAG: sugar ABC transporter ATP-binding protein [Treponema sp.]|nr:sugar ABC transporter ATP-binding protein [Treponema sp.]